MKLVMKKQILILLISIQFLSLTAQSKKYATGLIFDKVKYGQVPQKSKIFKSQKNIPTQVDLETYCPSVGDQGEYSTCSAFASTYYGRTILQSQALKLNDRSDIDKEIFSPTYVYEYIKFGSESDCHTGTYIEDALFTLKTKGAPKLSVYGYPACGTNEGDYDTDASPYKIKDYTKLFSFGDGIDIIIPSIKSALQAQHPVVIGMHVPNSFQLLIGDSWTPTPEDYNMTQYDGHAMCIIGYDDDKNGGSVKLINSWTANWGDQGKAWIKYSDLAMFIASAFEMHPLENPAPAPSEVAMKSNITFSLNNGTMMNFNKTSEINKAKNKFGKGYKNLNNIEDIESNIVAYRSSTNYKSGTSFKFKINNSIACYIYAYASDLSGKVNKIFPFTSGDSPLANSNTTATYPGENRSVQLDDTKGTDYLLILCSKEELNVEELDKSFAASEGNFPSKIMNSLGSKLISAKDIIYQTASPGYELKGNPSGTVVPVLIEIDHK
jgi:hypothetical protein